jgi:hypothetical protein
VPSPVSPKERAEYVPIITTVECPRCNAKPGEPCVYKNNARRRGDAHDARFIALRKSKSKRPRVSKYGNTQGHNVEDLRPLASRRLTIREERDAGIWRPLKEEKT